MASLDNSRIDAQNDSHPDCNNLRQCVTNQQLCSTTQPTKMLIFLFPPHQQRQIQADIHAHQKRLKSFIADFLTFSAIETKNLNMNFQAGDLNTCLAEVCSLWMPRFQQKGVGLYFRPEDELEPFAFDHL